MPRRRTINFSFSHILLWLAFAVGVWILAFVVHSLLDGAGSTLRDRGAYFGILSASVAIFGFAFTRLSRTASVDRRADAGELETFRLIAETSEDAVWLAEVDPENLERRLTFVNDEFETIWGRCREELYEQGCVHSNWIHEDDRERVAAGFAAFVQGDGVCDIEYRIIRPDGEARWIWTKARRVLDANRRTLKVTGVSRDMTQQKEAEFALRQSEKRYRVLFDNSRDAIQFCSLDGRFLNVNAAFERMLGYSREEVLNLSWEQITPKDWVETERRIVESQILSRGFSDLFEKELLAKNGERVPVAVRASLVHSESGEPSSIFGIVRDITEQKRQQRELLKAKSAAEAASAAKDRFLAVVSHELRNPLNPIVGYAEILATRVSDPEARRFLQIIKESARGMATLVSDILDYSLIESGRVGIETREFRLSELIVLVGEQTEPRARAALNSFRVEYRCEDYLVSGDEHKVQQIVLNLLTNACKFTRKGSIALTCDLLERQGDTASFAIAVADTGAGIAPEHLKPIFEPFVQAPGTGKAQGHGAGLGLAICSQLARALGGRIEVESQFGKGSVFRLVLPFEIMEGRKEAPEGPAARRSLSLSREYNVLIVEDDAANLSLLRDRLAGYGCKVDTALSAEASLELLHRETYDMVLMDVSLSGMSGIEATARLRQSESRNRSVPIIGISAHASEEIRQKCQEIGMDDFLTKPLSSEAFEHALTRWLARRG